MAGYRCHALLQALLEGISLSQPQPKIPSELIRFLGKTYSAWHIAIPLLESHVMLFPMACFSHHPPTATPCIRASESSGISVGTKTLTLTLHLTLSSRGAQRLSSLMRLVMGSCRRRAASTAWQSCTAC